MSPQSATVQVERGREVSVATSRALLCAVNFPAGTGFAWRFIEELYAAIARRLAEKGIATWVAYPELSCEPVGLRESPARPVEQDVAFGDPAALARLVSFIRRHRVQVLYLPDRATWNPLYPAVRVAGVRRIVIHDHTSGARTRPTGVKRIAKSLSRSLPGTLADRVIGVSDYVARRKVEVDLVPPERVVRIWNSVRLPLRGSGREGNPLERLGLPGDRPVVACACRAAPEKGVGHLLRAFDRLADRSDLPERPVLLYMGAGPAMARLERLRNGLSNREDVFFAGYREDAAELVARAHVAVVPSVWEEAFGLAALEAMAAGVPVVASRVGGLPEVVSDGETGLLVPPGDERAIETALARLLRDPEARRRFGEQGRTRARTLFSRERQVNELVRVLEACFP